METTTLPQPARRRTARPLVATLAGLAVSGLALVATAGPASATNEFPAAPTATAAIGCDDGAAVVTIELGNTAGLGSAHFDITQTGFDDLAYDVAAGGTQEVKTYGVPENSDVAVSVTGTDDFSYETTLHANCFDFVGGITLTCDGEQPVLTGVVSAIGTYGDNLDFTVSGEIVDGVELAAGADHTFTAEVPDGVAFTSTIVSIHDGTITDLSGTPDCTPEPTTSTTVVPTTPAPTDPPQVISEQATPPAPPAVAPSVAPTELPRTGSNNVPLAVLGATLIGVGAFVRRFAFSRRA
ncbi:LPXTG cell wall anchor domain-containing protein [Aquihabitans sp. G128]|uniref:LPXTG cell wall anchor domain-containing protein n=1 Tax=Aquihabitans sp. G128 TaxID=2849779 RepID=UPI001C22342F|nr:LPXTG cell wall anchor domain-containing protein [Aquihabitans sp. G128]QXC60749.1 LPXTG cell wall anchor domain-containing protein [Aquihabitans sp. G128]